MSDKRTTADKRNRCKIRSRIHRTIFKAFLEETDGQASWLSGIFDRPELSKIADRATSAIMKESRLDVVLHKPS